MRTLLTYVLAVGAAYVTAFLIRLGAIYWSLRGGEQSDSVRDSMAVSFDLSFVTTMPMPVFAVAWSLLFFLVVKREVAISGMWLPFTGAVLGALIAAAMVAITGRTGAGLLTVLSLILAGTAWGTVFWIRAPKPTTAGIAA